MKSIQKLKIFSKERCNVITYFEIGKLLKEVGNRYGENKFVLEYSSDKRIYETTYELN